MLNDRGNPNAHSSISTELKPTFSAKELALFKRLMDRAESYVEYGSGYSTWLAASRGLRTVTVESDLGWLQKLRGEKAVSEAERSGRLTLLHADIGPTKALGYPADEGRKPEWPTYARRPWSFEATDRTLILVDGRFRVACAIMSAAKATENTTIVIHDFWNRPHYHAALAHLEWVDSADTMGVFRRKSTINTGKALEDFARFQYVPE